MTDFDSLLDALDALVKMRRENEDLRRDNEWLRVVIARLQSLAISPIVGPDNKDGYWCDPRPGQPEVYIDAAMKRISAEIERCT